MLLRASGEEAGDAPPDLRASVGEGDGGVAHGAQLVRFGETITRGSDDADDARAELRAALGEVAFADAAGIVGIFNGLVRTADATGIPLDENTLQQSAAFREELGLNAFAGAQNSPLEREDASAATPPERGDVLGQFK